MNPFDQAAQAFWGRISQDFPELTTGDSQISGEDHTALAQWALGASASDLDPPVWDSPCEAFTLDLGVASERIERATSAAIEAAGHVLKATFPHLGTIPANSEATLRACVRQILFWNFPRTRCSEIDVQSGASFALA